MNPEEKFYYKVLKSILMDLYYDIFPLSKSPTQNELIKFQNNALEYYKNNTIFHTRVHNLISNINNALETYTEEILKIHHHEK